jgi:hypothetical protein
MPFRDPKDPRANGCRFENNLNDAQLVRGQLASYAGAHSGRQFRVHIFSVLICVRFARFIRWDPNGATVIQHFDYINNTQDDPAHHEFCIPMVPYCDDPELGKPFKILFPLNYTTPLPFGQAT